MALAHPDTARGVAGNNHCGRMRSRTGRVTRPSGPGLGLVGMRERVSALGGRLQAGPQDGGGFQVRAELPARAPS
jgi:signal transduction histidine kinase